VASRSLRDVQAFRDVAMSLICATMVVALIAVFESLRYWLLYVPLEAVLGAESGMFHYLGRGSFLRAQGPTGQAIVLGYLMVVALGLFPYLRRSIPRQTWWWLGFGLLLAGLTASFSRGPWLAGLVALTVFRLTMPKAIGGSLKAAVVVATIALAVMASPIGTEVKAYLPFVGSIENENVDYRQHLLEVSIQVILQNPVFGSTSYMYSLIDQDLVIGGMVDVVNTFLGIGLANGLVGLGCFVGAFAYVIVGVLRGMRRLPDHDGEQHALGSGLLACVAGVMATIFTVSSISFVPVVYWTVLGLAAGYARLRPETPTGDVAVPPAPRFSLRVGLARPSGTGSGSIA
jgi:O-antigen ligase